MIHPQRNNVIVEVDKTDLANKYNYASGRDPLYRGRDTGNQVELRTIVIHVADGTYSGTISWFKNPDCDVSAHYVVSMSGEVCRCVPDEDTAFHSGNQGMNFKSIGIEHEGRPSKEPWTPSDRMYESSAKLVAQLCARWGVTPTRKTIIGHNEVDRTRKDRAGCPGPTWDWTRFMGMVLKHYGKLTATEPGHKPIPDSLKKRAVRLITPDDKPLDNVASYITGTDKVYVVGELPYIIGQPKKEYQYARVRLFSASQNTLIGEGTLNALTGTVYITKTNPAL